MGKVTPLYYVAFIIVASFIPYWPIASHDFVSYDDLYYIVDNPLVNGGITCTTILTSFTTLTQGHWHPLTWISHQLDVSLFGMNAGAHHLMNVALHAANASILFLLCRKLSFTALPSVLVALLFALHPLHVESVAWASERKDVLCTLFFLLTLLSYLSYARNKTLATYLTMTLCFMAACMSKSMAVTVPLLMLLLDWWPLGRTKNERIFPLLAEKLPLFALSAAVSWLAIVAQKVSGAMDMRAHPGVAPNIANAIRSTVIYLLKIIWPTDLAPLYPFPLHIPPWQVILSSLLVIVFTGTALQMRRRRPWLAFGWFWYLITITPVIGIVHVGVQAWADRYSYIPLIGIFVLVAREVEVIVGARRKVAIIVIGSVTLLLSSATYQQVGIWRTSETLFSATVARTDNNFIMMHNLGDELLRQNRLAEGVLLHKQALNLNRNDPESYFSYGNALLTQHEFKEAENQYRQALQRRPKSSTIGKVYNNLATALLNQERPSDALEMYRTALNRAPNSKTVRQNISAVLRDNPELAESGEK